MTPTQREAALRLAKALQNLGNEEEEAAALLLELAAEPEPNPFVGTMAEQLLQVIAGIWTEHPDYSLRQTLEALNALMLPAEPVQEPVSGVVIASDGQPTLVVRGNEKAWVQNGRARYLYAAPQQRKPLTLEQIDRLDTQAIHSGPDSQYAFRFARLIEAAHGIKETP